MSDILTEIGDKRVFKLPYEPPFDPHPETGTCRCSVCNVAWYARHDALDKLIDRTEEWVIEMVDTENVYSDYEQGDPLFDVLHSLLNKARDTLIEAVNFEDDRIRDLRGE